MRISYYQDGCNYRFTDRRRIKEWLGRVASAEGFTLEDIGVIFCSSERLLAMNNEFLSHDYLTDIITFDLSDETQSSSLVGELYIDVDTVKDNAIEFDSTPLREMHRILAHGVLHLCGQKDKSEVDSKEMRRKENLYLALLDTI